MGGPRRVERGRSAHHRSLRPWRALSVDTAEIRRGMVWRQVILTANVRSWAERQEAERAAWAAPGVTQVDDRLLIAP